MKRLAATIFNNDIVVLDIDGDEYYITEKEASQAKVDKTQLIEHMKCFGEHHLIYLNLSDAVICQGKVNIEESLFPQVTTFNPQGNVSYFFKLVRSSIKLVSICRSIMKNKWSFILESKPEVNKRGHNKQDQELLINICLWKIINTFHLNFNEADRLTTSVVLQHFLAEQGISSTLVIGVKTRPFFSHAWIEVEGKVINDHAELRNSLSIILEVKS